jgi:CubicO group peptidase (beta-lactamase class C family)
MGRRPGWAVWILLAVGCSHGATPAASGRPELREEWLTALQSDVGQIAANDGFQGAVRVVRAAKVDIDDAFGDRSCLPLGSGRRLLSIVAVAALVDEGKLNFDDRVVRFLPQYERTSFDRLTVAHLLAASSGLAPTAGATPADALAAAAKVPLGASPGTRIDTADERPWLLLEQVVAAASGRSLAEVLQERVLSPAGLAETSLGPTSTCPAAAGGTSSVGDLLRLGEALRSGKLVRPSTRDALWAGRIDLGPGLQRGLGFTLRGTETQQAVGFSAVGPVPALELWINPGNGDMLALIGRTDTRSAQHLRTALGEFFGLPPGLSQPAPARYRPH